MNFLGATISKKNGLNFGSGIELTMALPSSCKVGEKLTLGCRPEHILFDEKGKLQVTGKVDIIERLGEIGYAHVVLPTGQTVVAQVNGNPRVDIGDEVPLALPEKQIHLFDERGMALQS